MCALNPHRRVKSGAGSSPLPPSGRGDEVWAAGIVGGHEGTPPLSFGYFPREQGKPRGPGEG